MKKWIALALISVLCVGVATGVILDPGPREKHLGIPHKITYSDFGAYGKWRIDMLNSISIYSPEKKALYINFILDKRLYEYCLKDPNSPTRGGIRPSPDSPESGGTALTPGSAGGS